MRLKLIIIIAVLVVVLFLLFLYPFFYRFLFNMPEKEVIVIGLDGGDSEIILSSIDRNKLPNLEKIIEDGSLAFFRTSESDTYSAWNSIARCDENSLWGKLKERNTSFGTVYWPNVPENGLFRIPNEFEGNAEWPKDIYDSKALLIFKNPVTEFFRKLYWNIKIMFPKDENEKDLVYEFYLLDRKAREFFYLREKFKPDLSFLVLDSPLRIEQYFWMYAHPEKFSNYMTENEKEKYGKVIENYYVEIDKFIGELNKENKILVIISNMEIREVYPPKIVDKIDINKILKEEEMLVFDYRGEVDFSKTKAYTLEEGLDKELKVFIKGENFTEINDKLKRVFDEATSLPSKQKIFIVEDFEKGIILRRNTSYVIEDDRFSISGKTYPSSEFILRRVISAAPIEKGFLLVNKKIDVPENMKSEDFCEVLLNLIS